MDRRESLQWMLAAAALPSMWGGALAQPATARGYGTDPNLVKSHQTGALWPLAMNATQRRAAAALCAAIIPADEQSPSAAELGVHVFIDEWISAPYPAHAKDRALIEQGLAWIDAESQQRFGRPFAEAAEAQQRAICDDICFVPKAAPQFAQAAAFFARYRDLTAGGFYTTPQGTKDLRFVGNVASVTFDGPPMEVLKIVGVQG
jgi:hypothetical protein